jgi:hypothetical protein
MTTAARQAVPFLPLRLDDGPVTMAAAIVVSGPRMLWAWFAASVDRAFLSQL